MVPASLDVHTLCFSSCGFSESSKSLELGFGVFFGYTLFSLFYSQYVAVCFCPHYSASISERIFSFSYQMVSFLNPHSSTAFFVLLFQNTSSCPREGDTFEHLSGLGRKAWLPNIHTVTENTSGNQSSGGTGFLTQHLLFPIFVCITCYLKDKL